jgi:hypothetical protein
MTYDIIVAGFGTAGAIAAIAAARKGVKVLVLEKGTYPGGLQTGGFINGYYVQEPSGLAAEIERKGQQQAALAEAYDGGVEPKKWVLEQEALAAGTDLRYGANIRAVHMGDRRIRGLAWDEAGTTFEATATVVIDATAEAEIAFLAGCADQRGRAGDGLCQHAATIFRSRRQDGSYAYQAPPLRAYQHDAEAFSTALIQASANLLGAKNLVMAGDLPGMREGRHVVTRRVLTLADCLLDPEPVPDPVAFIHSHVDTNISDYALESETFQDWMVVSAMWGTRLWFAVPQETLVVRDVDGLLLAGRHFGVDHDTGHALRMNAGMGSLGEAAGLLAAAAVRLGILPSEVPYSAVAVDLDLSSAPFARNDTIWELDDSAIREGLASEVPGRAIWTAYRNRRSDLLLSCLAEATPGSRLAAQATFALALLGDRTALPILRQLAEQQSDQTLHSSMPDTDGKTPLFTVRFDTVSIYLLGRMRDEKSIALLARCLAGPGTEDTFPRQSSALVALLKIGEEHPRHRSEVAGILQSFAADPDWCLSARFIKFLRQPVVRMDAAFRELVSQTSGTQAQKGAS